MVFVFYKLCKETRQQALLETQRRDDLQLELELIEIEIIELFKKMNEEKMNEVVVVVNPDGKQLQLGTKINN